MLFLQILGGFLCVAGCLLIANWTNLGMEGVLLFILFFQGVIMVRLHAVSLDIREMKEKQKDEKNSTEEKKECTEKSDFS